jgi:glucose-1-phosphate thymidylyltransferase
MHLAYLMMGLPFGVPYTLDQAYPFLEDALVVLGFPDMIFQPEDAFVRLLAKGEESSADIVLGLFPALQPHKTDMVELDENGRIRSIQIKPDQTQLLYAWEIAIWTPIFTRFMHDYVLSRQVIGDKSKIDIGLDEQNELHVADVIQAAIQNDMQVDSVIFKDGSCLDIGTPEDMMKAIQDNI